MSSQSEALSDAAVPMTCGNAVAPGNSPPNLTPGPVSDTPWSASDHHSYPPTPSRSTPAALFTSSRTFSARVNLDTKSLARDLAGSERRQNGSEVAGPPAAHANAARALAAGVAADDAASTAAEARRRRRARRRMAGGRRRRGRKENGGRWSGEGV